MEGFADVVTRYPRPVDPELGQRIRADRLKWALLGSGYVHVGVVLLLVGGTLVTRGRELPLEGVDEGRMAVHLVSVTPRHDRAPGQVEVQVPRPRLLDQVVRSEPGEMPTEAALHSQADSRGALEEAARIGPELIGEGGGSAGGGRPRQAAAGRIGGGSASVDGFGGRFGAPLAPGGTRAPTSGRGGWMQGRAGASGAPGRLHAVLSHRDLEVDPIPELQDALGIESFDRSRRPAARPELRPGPERAPGGTDFQRLATRRTPLGIYVGVVEDLIHERWAERELPIEDRARGIQGTVSVAYTIDRRGGVRTARVVRSSGNPELDQMALDAVPDRFPPLPRDLDRDQLAHRVNLTYRNPLVAMGNR